MSMIICKECGKEFSDKASACPNCGCPIEIKNTKNNKKSPIKTFGMIFFAIIFIFYVLSDSNDEPDKVVDISETSKIENTENNSSKNINETNTDLEEKEQSELIEISPEKTYYLNDMKVTILSVDLDYTDYEDEYGWYALEDEMKCIKIGFQYENNGKEDSYVSIYDYTCYADGNLCEQTYYFGGDFINTNLGSGRKVSFELFFIVPTNAQSIELECKPNMWEEEKVILKLK